MAGSGINDFCGNWWGGWLQTAKEKSTAALDMVRKDLAEFGCTMQKDTSHAVEVTSTTLKESLQAENTSTTKERLTKGLNTFLEGISKALVVPPDDEGQIPITASSVDLYDRTKTRLLAMQLDPETYLREPEGPPEAYHRWCESFDLDSAKGEVSELLVSKAEVRRLYTKLVPSRVSHVDFWRHYFYKRHQIELDQARKEALMKRAEQSRGDSSLSWEDDWSGDEAAEDSGSDWEKLPGPSQKVPSPDPSMPNVEHATPASKASMTHTPLLKHRADSGNAAQSGSESSQILPPSDCSQVDPENVPQQDSGPARAMQSASDRDAVTSEEACGAFVILHPQADEKLSLAGGIRNGSHQQRLEEHVQSGSPSSSNNSEAEQTDEGCKTDSPTSLLPDTVSKEVCLLQTPDCGEPSLQVEPVKKSEDLASNKVEPVSSQAEPVSSQAEPVSSQAEPVSSQAEPVSSQAEPVSSQAEPVSSQPEPVSSQAEPVSSQAEPVSSQPEAVSSQPEPVSSQAKPVSSQAEPVSSQAEPVSSQPEAVSSQIEPVNSQPEPVSSQPEAVSSQPEPVSSQPEAVNCQAEPVSNQAELESCQDHGEGETQVEPVRKSEELISDQVKPVGGQAEPGDESSAAIIGQLDPVSGKDEPVSPEVTSSSVTHQSEVDRLSMKHTEQPDLTIEEKCEAAVYEESEPGTADPKQVTTLTTANLAATTPAEGVTASSMEDDWEEDLDIEVTEEDMKAAEYLAKKLGENTNLEEDDWENWE